MSRGTLTLLLLAALCLALVSCSRQTPPSGSGGDEPGDIIDPGVPADVPLEIDVLRVEFVTGGRDVDELLKLQSAFPQALIDALADWNVNVGSVNVTFGTSDEATVTALQSGAVDVGFLSAEAYFAHEDALLCAATEVQEPPGLDLSVIVLRADADAALENALRGAAESLAPVLASYPPAREGGEADGLFTADASALDALRLLHEAESNG